MSQAPHPLEIRTRLMCALLGAGHNVATAAAMLDRAEAAVLCRPADSRQNPPEKRETTAAMESHGNSIATPAPKRAGRSAAERLAELDTAGLTAMEIADKVGAPVQQVYTLCRSHGIPFLSAIEKRERERRALNGKAAKPWPAEIRKVLAAGPASDALPDGRARFPQVMRRRCDCGRLFETDVVDQTMCATCTENAARHREAQAGREAR